VIPSTLFFLYLNEFTTGSTDSQKALFLAIHYLSAGVAVYFTLTELKKKSIEEVSFMRYMITGILSTVSHGLIFGLISGIYFNLFNPDAKQKYVDEVLTPAIVRGFDSTANTKEEYYEHLMRGKDTGVLLPERHKIYEKAAQDSLAQVDDVIHKISQKNFSFSGNIISWVGFAPIIGMLFSVIVTVFITKREG
jgi:hypothetical protein